MQSRPRHGHSYSIPNPKPILSIPYWTNCLDYQDKMAPMQRRGEVKTPSVCFSGLFNILYLPCFKFNCLKNRQLKTEDFFRKVLRNSLTCAALCAFVLSNQYKCQHFFSGESLTVIFYKNANIIKMSQLLVQCIDRMSSLPRVIYLTFKLSIQSERLCSY